MNREKGVEKRDDARVAVGDVLSGVLAKWEDPTPQVAASSRGVGFYGRGFAVR